MKECMYSYHYHRRRAIIQRDRRSHRAVVFAIGIVAIFSFYCITTLLRA